VGVSYVQFEQMMPVEREHYMKFAIPLENI
jgi:hypothetical protein